MTGGLGKEEAASRVFSSRQPPSSPPRAHICDVIRARALNSCHHITVGEILAVRIGEILPLKSA